MTNSSLHFPADTPFTSSSAPKVKVSKSPVTREQSATREQKTSRSHLKIAPKKTVLAVFDYNGTIGQPHFNSDFYKRHGIKHHEVRTMMNEESPIAPDSPDSEIRGAQLTYMHQEMRDGHLREHRFSIADMEEYGREIYPLHGVLEMLTRLRRDVEAQNAELKIVLITNAAEPVLNNSILVTGGYVDAVYGQQYEDRLQTGGVPIALAKNFVGSDTKWDALRKVRHRFGIASMEDVVYVCDGYSDTSIIDRLSEAGGSIVGIIGADTIHMGRIGRIPSRDLVERTQRDLRMLYQLQANGIRMVVVPGDYRELEGHVSDAEATISQLLVSRAQGLAIELPTPGQTDSQGHRYGHINMTREQPSLGGLELSIGA